MALELIATPGAPDANSFTTLAEADDYHAGHVSGATWLLMTVDDRTTALIMATRLLNVGLTWTGHRSTPTQALAWPRTGMTYEGIPLPADVVPTPVKQATAELARLLHATDRTTESVVAALGLTRVKTGPVELAFKNDAALTPPLIPTAVRVLLPPAWYETPSAVPTVLFEVFG